MNNLKTHRTNNYNAKDSAIAFLLALVLPQVLIYLLIAIFGKSLTGNNNLYIFACALVPQIGMLISFVIVSERKKVNYVTANKITVKKFNWWAFAIVLVIGVICLFGFSPIVNLFDHIVGSLGYTSSASQIDVSTTQRFIVSIFIIALLPAVCEELIFRGVITNGLNESFGTKTAVIFSSILFALMHQNLQQFFYQMFLGGVMAYIVIKTGSIVYTMILHFVNNFVVLLNSHLSGGQVVNLDYSNAWNVIWPILVAILSVCVVVALLFVLNKVMCKKEKKSEFDVLYDKVQEQQSVTSDMQSNKNSIKTNDENNQQQKSKIQWKSVFSNPFMVCALVCGVVMWLLVIISSFGK